MTARNGSAESRGSCGERFGNDHRGRRGSSKAPIRTRLERRRGPIPSIGVHHEERIEIMITHGIAINRPAEEVFAYLDQVDRHNEWQDSLVSATIKTDGPTRVGTRVIERRNVPGGTRDIPYEITEHDPPRKASFRGTAGPLRPVGTYTVDPTGESSSRMNLELDLEGHGIGKLFAILARRQATKQVPVDHEKFKERLESGIAAAASN
jgi:uncharacterized membrane protein